MPAHSLYILQPLNIGLIKQLIGRGVNYNEVELQVKAAGINFRDIMSSMGLLPVTGIGQEASGIVDRTGGQGAKSLKPGDRVSTLTVGGTHTTKIRCDYRVAQKIPDAMSFEEAAGVPVVHCTAYYALVRLAKLRRGQSVLIHAAAGGTEEAAVQLAKHMGLVVYATVGTEDKSAHHRGVWHSRGAHFQLARR